LKNKEMKGQKTVRTLDRNQKYHRCIFCCIVFLMENAPKPRQHCTLSSAAVQQVCSVNDLSKLGGATKRRSGETTEWDNDAGEIFRSLFVPAARTQGGAYWDIRQGKRTLEISFFIPFWEYCVSRE
jgi:hypothetical protein